jgi:PAS domain S-box-containing protein
VNGRSLDTIEDLHAGDHLCCIYETEEEHRKALAPFLRRGLEHGEKVLYAADDSAAEVILNYLRDDGVDVAPYLASGQLDILTRGGAYYIRGDVFDPDAMIALLREETEQALIEGYEALRVTGEMSWALRGLPGYEPLIEYEARLNSFFPGSKCLAICQYDRRLFEPGMLLDVLRTHPIALIGAEVYRNFYHVPPSEFLDEESEAAELRYWIKNLDDRKRAEKALRESGRRYRSFFQTSRDCVFVTSKEGHWVDLNDAAVELFGYESKEELRAVRIPDLYENPTDRELHIRTIEEQGFTEEYPVNLRRKDGRIINALITSVPVLDESGNAIGFQGTIRDITNRKRAERALRKSEARFRNLFETSPDTVFLLSKDGVFEEINEPRITGHSREEIIGKHFQDVPFITEESKREAAEHFRERVKGTDVPPYPIEIRTRHGETRYAEINATTLTEDDKITGIIGIARDITERKRIERQLREHRGHLEELVQERTAELKDRMAEVERLNRALTNLLEDFQAANRRLEDTSEKLTEANEELEAFAYSVSHDLRAPLRAMDGFSRLLLEEHASELSSEAQRYVHLLHESAQQMDQLVRGLLAFSRLSRRSLRKQKVVPSDLVEQVLEDLHEMREGRQVEITVGDLPACRADPRLLKQVWSNLLANALKFTRCRKVARIEIGCQQRQAECVYFVKDNGVGFDMQYVDKLFGVFQRLHRAKDYEGTGVGLAIVQRIVRRHGGRVWAEAETEKGATFYFTV